MAAAPAEQVDVAPTPFPNPFPQTAVSSLPHLGDYVRLGLEGVERQEYRSGNEHGSDNTLTGTTPTQGLRHRTCTGGLLGV